MKIYVALNLPADFKTLQCLSEDNKDVIQSNSVYIFDFDSWKNN